VASTNKTTKRLCGEQFRIACVESGNDYAWAVAVNSKIDKVFPMLISHLYADAISRTLEGDKKQVYVGISDLGSLYSFWNLLKVSGSSIEEMSVCASMERGLDVNMEIRQTRMTESYLYSIPARLPEVAVLSVVESVPLMLYELPQTRISFDIPSNSNAVNRAREVVLSIEAYISDNEDAADAFRNGPFQ
jgi:hypothetical protein